MRPRTALPAAFLALLGLALFTQERATAPGTEPRFTGEGEHTYLWDRDWPKLPDGVELGNTHGRVVLDRAGHVYVNTDTEQAVMVFDAEGKLLRSFGAELKEGLHGMTLVERDGEQLLYLTHIRLGEVLGATLEGEILWRLGAPVEPGIYGEGVPYRPTDVAVAPNGHMYVADGYGASWIHEYDAERRWVRTFGGPGSGPGQLRTPHGIAVDTRGETPVLVVADRVNRRLQTFTLEGEHLATWPKPFRRPCSIDLRGDFMAVADLHGRVTILDRDFRVVTHLGANPDRSLWAQNDVPPEKWRPGLFLSPHDATWDAEGNLYVVDWNSTGRVTRLLKQPPDR